MNMDLTPLRPHDVEIIDGGSLYHVEGPNWQFRFPRSGKALLLLRDVIEYLIAVSGGNARLSRNMPHGVTVQQHTTFTRVLGLTPRGRDGDESFQVIIPSDREALGKLQETIDYLRHDEKQRKVAEAGSRQAANSSQQETHISDVGKTAATVLCLLLFLLPLNAHAQSRQKTSAATNSSAILAAAITRRHPVLVLLWELVRNYHPASDDAPRLDYLPRHCVPGQRVIVGQVLYVCKQPPLRAASRAASGAGQEFARLSDARLTQLYRTRLREARAMTPNFAGHYVLSLWGCGTECLMGAVVDPATGAVAWLPFDICCWHDAEPIEFSVASNTITVHGTRLNGRYALPGNGSRYRLVRGRWMPLT